MRKVKILMVSRYGGMAGSHEKIPFSQHFNI